MLARIREARMASVAEQIRNKNAEFVEAFHRKDGAAIAAMYSTTAKVLPPGGDTVEGKSKIQAFWESVFKAGITDAKLESVEVDLIGGYTAIETGRFEMHAGRETVDRGKYLVVWRNEDGQWTLHRDVWNSSVPKMATVGA
jgi:uncharacterized protein (TIGR02246 family)